MNTMNTPEHRPDEAKKDMVMKSLAVIGFIVAMIILAWVAVQAVRFIPVAFTSLASLVEGLDRNGGREFSITSEENMVNVGETLTISWTAAKEDGTYAFSYGCAEGVSMRAVIDGEESPLACETELVLGEDTTSLEVIFMSEKNRFTDILYTISFVGEDGDEYERDSVATVINPDIVASTTPREEEPEEEEPQTGGPQTTPRPTTTVTVPVVVTKFPESNPNGYADLKLTLIGIGEYRNGRFVRQSSIDEGEDGAIQFEVRNIGTKISGDWNMRAELPTESSSNFVSALQRPLLPNEYQLITIRFENASDERVSATVYSQSDTNLTNNSLSRHVDVN